MKNREFEQFPDISTKIRNQVKLIANESKNRHYIEYTQMILQNP